MRERVSEDNRTADIRTGVAQLRANNFYALENVSAYGANRGLATGGSPASGQRPEA